MSDLLDPLVTLGVSAGVGEGAEYCYSLTAGGSQLLATEEGLAVLGEPLTLREDAAVAAVTDFVARHSGSSPLIVAFGPPPTRPGTMNHSRVFPAGQWPALTINIYCPGR